MKTFNEYELNEIWTQLTVLTDSFNYGTKSEVEYKLYFEPKGYDGIVAACLEDWFDGELSEVYFIRDFNPNKDWRREILAARKELSYLMVQNMPEPPAAESGEAA